MRFTNSLIVFGCLALTACGSKDACDRPLPYVDSKTGSELVVPDDLSKPSSANQKTIPDLSSSRRERTNPCNAGPPELIAERKKEVVVNDGASDEADKLPEPPLNIAVGYKSDSVEDTLAAWIQSWRSANSPEYLSFYAKDFEGIGEVRNREAWLRRRHDLLVMTGPADISVRDISIEDLPAGRKLVRLIQDFKSSDEVRSVVKIIEMVREDDAWRIRREQVVKVL